MAEPVLIHTPHDLYEFTPAQLRLAIAIAQEFGTLMLTASPTCGPGHHEDALLAGAGPSCCSPWRRGISSPGRAQAGDEGGRVMGLAMTHDEDETVEYVNYGTGEHHEIRIGLDHAESRARSQYIRGEITVEEYERAARIMSRDGRICHVCLKPMADEVDHVIPLAEGGADDDSNLRPIHSRPCHRARNPRS